MKNHNVWQRLPVMLHNATMAITSPLKYRWSQVNCNLPCFDKPLGQIILLGDGTKFLSSGELQVSYLKFPLGTVKGVVAGPKIPVLYATHWVKLMAKQNKNFKISSIRKTQQLPSQFRMNCGVGKFLNTVMILY